MLLSSALPSAQKLSVMLPISKLQVYRMNRNRYSLCGVGDGEARVLVYGGDNHITMHLTKGVHYLMCVVIDSHSMNETPHS